MSKSFVNSSGLSPTTHASEAATHCARHQGLIELLRQSVHACCRPTVILQLVLPICAWLNECHVSVDQPAIGKCPSHHTYHCSPHCHRRLACDAGLWFRFRVWCAESAGHMSTHHDPSARPRKNNHIEMCYATPCAHLRQSPLQIGTLNGIDNTDRFSLA